MGPGFVSPEVDDNPDYLYADNQLEWDPTSSAWDFGSPAMLYAEKQELQRGRWEISDTGLLTVDHAEMVVLRKTDDPTTFGRYRSLITENGMLESIG